MLVDAFSFPISQRLYKAAIQIGLHLVSNFKESIPTPALQKHFLAKALILISKCTVLYDETLLLQFFARISPFIQHLSLDPRTQDNIIQVLKKISTAHKSPLILATNMKLCEMMMFQSQRKALIVIIVTSALKLKEYDKADFYTRLYGKRKGEDQTYIVLTYLLYLAQDKDVESVMEAYIESPLFDFKHFIYLLERTPLERLPSVLKTCFSHIVNICQNRDPNASSFCQIIIAWLTANRNRYLPLSAQSFFRPLLEILDALLEVVH